MTLNPNIYNVSAHEDFFKTLSYGIIKRVFQNSNPKDIIILLPTQHSCNFLKKELLKFGPVLPQIYSIGNLNLLIKENHEKAVLSRIKLIIKISEIISQNNFQYNLSLNSITTTSEYLANLIFQLELHDISIDSFMKAIDDGLTIHQQELFQMVKHVLKIWQDSSYISKAGFNNILIRKLLKKNSKKTIVIAGIYSNIPSINRLIEDVIKSQKDYLVFYGIDKNLTTADWQYIDSGHPQYIFKKIFSQCNLDPCNIKPWVEMQFKDFYWLTHALAPATLTKSWHNLKKFDITNYKYLTCPDQHYEAKAIIKIINENKNKNIMIVTADESLMLKLILHLQSSNIKADIIRDYPLIKTKPACWMNLCFEAALDKFSINSVLSLLKFEYSKIDYKTVEEIEITLRDNSYTKKNITNIDIENEEFKHFLLEIKKFREFITANKLSFAEILKLHLELAQNLAKQSLWESNEEKELRECFDKLEEATSNLICHSLNDYFQAYSHFLKSFYYRKSSSEHKITLLKPIDASLCKADLMILAGVNETIWPKKQAISPFLSQSLYKKIGLPNHNEFKSIEAYNFQCLSQANEVIVTRSEKQSGNITLPNSWILRILTIAKKMNINITYDFKVEETNIPIIEDFITSPIPPLNARPTQLSATQIDKLIFNPYHIYTDLILKLKKLPSFEKKISGIDFGIFIHKTLELYNQSQQNKLESLLNCGKQALLELNLDLNLIELTYWSKFIRIAKWFVANQNLETKQYFENYGRFKLSKDFLITARADKIEISLDNKIHIVDYKTGKLSSSKAIISGQNLQLLIEGMIARSGGFICQKFPQEVGSLTYVQLSGNEQPVEVLEIDLSGEDILEKTKIYLEQLILEYQNPITPYHYTQKKKLGYCEYAHLARIFD